MLTVFPALGRREDHEGCVGAGWVFKFLVCPNDGIHLCAWGSGALGLLPGFDVFPPRCLVLLKLNVSSNASI